MSIAILYANLAWTEMAKLPSSVRLELENLLTNLANGTAIPGGLGRVRFNGVGPDGSRFDIEVEFEQDQDDRKFLVLIVDIFSY